MQLVDSPASFPARCIVTQRDEDPEGFVDTEQEFDGLRVYLSVGFLKDVMRLLNLPTPDEYGAIQELSVIQGREIEKLSQALHDAEEFKQSIHVIQGQGFKPQKKRGPKPKAQKTDDPKVAA